MTSQDPEYSAMTKACLVDHLKQHLASIESEEEGKYDNRKYYIQAHNQLKIGTFKPVPYFIRYLSDLTLKLIIELHSLDSRDPSYVKEDLSLYKSLGELAFTVQPADSLVMYTSNGHFPQIITMTGW
jgi:hypothetical protein